MSSRHTRRKAAKAKALAKSEALAQAHKAWERSLIVKRNLANPVIPIEERAWHGIVDSTLRVAGKAARAKGTGYMAKTETKGDKPRSLDPRQKSRNLPAVYYPVTNKKQD